MRSPTRADARRRDPGLGRRAGDRWAAWTSPGRARWFLYGGGAVSVVWLFVVLWVAGAFDPDSEPTYTMAQMPFDDVIDVGPQKRSILAFDVLADDLDLHWFVGVGVGEEVGFCFMARDQAEVYLDNGPTECKWVGSLSEKKKDEDTVALAPGEYAVGLHCRSFTKTCDVTVRLSMT